MSNEADNTDKKLVEVKLERLFAIFGALKSENVLDQAGEYSTKDYFFRDEKEPAVYSQFLDNEFGKDSSIKYSIVADKIIENIKSGNEENIVSKFGANILLYPLNRAMAFKGRVDFICLDIMMEPQIGVQLPDGHVFADHFVANRRAMKVNKIRAAMPMDFGHCTIR